MEESYYKWEFFTSEGKTCRHSFADWRPFVKESRTENNYEWARKILNSNKGREWGLTHFIVFFDVKEEDVEKELINSNYSRVTIYK